MQMVKRYCETGKKHQIQRFHAHYFACRVLVVDGAAVSPVKKSCVPFEKHSLEEPANRVNVPRDSDFVREVMDVKIQLPQCVCLP